MSATGFDSAISTLEDVLVREREMLLSGRARETAELVKEKMSALEVFDSMLIGRSEADVPQDQRQRIDSLVSLARENGVHFAAVRNGLRNVITRLESQSDGAYVGSYSPDGARTPFPKATGGYLKKV